MKKWIPLAILCLCSCRDRTAHGWEVYGGSRAGTHYSSLKEIDTANVSQLQVAWEYHTGDADAKTQIQVNPIIVNGTLFGVSPRLKLFSLDAATGKPNWVFDPIDTSAGAKGKGYFSMNVCRGVTYYSDNGKDARIFYSAGATLFCIDAVTGRPVSSFGDSGKLDLHNDLGQEMKDLYIASTTPGVIYKDLLIIGSRVAEDASAAPGHIRAYDVHTGKLRWIFHTIPQPDEYGYDSWEDKNAYAHIGGANAWSGFSLDEEKGLVFAPIGSASFDFYGGMRLGADLFANCVLALDAATGKRVWHFQTVHHDLWDRDLPTAPVLVDLTKDGKKIEAVAQVTKSGFIFLLDRATGKPVYPVNETPVPTETALTGEKPWPTQPIPSFPKPFVRQLLAEKDLNHVVPDSSFQELKRRWQATKHDHLFTPPSKEGTVIFPGFDGGAEWGGPSYDPSTGILYVNASEMPWILTMVDLSKNKKNISEKNLDAGKRLYTTACMACHGAERKGSGNNPSLIGVQQKYTEQSFKQLLNAGRRMMPAFHQLSEGEKDALAAFILDNKTAQQKAFVVPERAMDPYSSLPYASTGYHKFLTKEGYPAVDTPWGSLNAINLNTGKLEWKTTLGDYPELKAKGIHSGTENYGGSAVTAGGIVFIAATSDKKIRAFHKRTGQLLWEHDLPAAGFATPSVYEKNGHQYIVIACGGGKLGAASGDSYVAFALPKS
ncbi:MAG: PQQ-binding-like beta-propeller repeat protein [Sediminibacterium sp.]|nr:PQQ-binding-like beta-propeller repeat protein [Sediminibacterium sp.]